MFSPDRPSIEMESISFNELKESLQAVWDDESQVGGLQNAKYSA